MLILASKSTARNALLAGAGLRFEASPAQIDERAVEADVLGKGGNAVAVARRLDEVKALAVSAYRPVDMVIGADQVLAETDGPLPRHSSVALMAFSPENAPLEPSPLRDGSKSPTRGERQEESVANILHKPVDLAEAAHQLDRLRGKTHYLHSGIALARKGKVLWSAVESAKLTMRSFSPAERDTVLALEGEAVLGSVGGYRLEGPSIRLFSSIEGDYFTILGLPLLPLLAALRLHAPDVFGK